MSKNLRGKPSAANSARAAEMLASMVSPSLASSQAHELITLLRKTGKRDVMTRCKAITELKQSLLETSDDVLSEFVPHFFSIFARQALLDCDWRVREGFQYLIGSIGTKLGRNIAPYLKEIFPSWFCGCFDPAREVLQSAKKSLDLIFPDSEKIYKAVLLCENELEGFIVKIISASAMELSEICFGAGCGPVDGDDEAERARVAKAACWAVTAYLIQKFPANFHKLKQLKPWEIFLSNSVDPAVRAKALECLVSCLKLPVFNSDDQIKLYEVRTVGLVDHENWNLSQGALEFCSIVQSGVENLSKKNESLYIRLSTLIDSGRLSLKLCELIKNSNSSEFQETAMMKISSLMLRGEFAAHSEMSSIDFAIKLSNEIFPTSVLRLFLDGVYSRPDFLPAFNRAIKTAVSSGNFQEYLLRLIDELKGETSSPDRVVAVLVCLNKFPEIDLSDLVDEIIGSWIDMGLTDFVIESVLKPGDLEISSHLLDRFKKTGGRLALAIAPKLPLDDRKFVIMRSDVNLVIELIADLADEKTEVNSALYPYVLDNLEISKLSLTSLQTLLSLDASVLRDIMSQSGIVKLCRNFQLSEISGKIFIKWVTDLEISSQSDVVVVELAKDLWTNSFTPSDSPMEIPLRNILSGFGVYEFMRKYLSLNVFVSAAWSAAAENLGIDFDLIKPGNLNSQQILAIANSISARSEKIPFSGNFLDFVRELIGERRFGWYAEKSENPWPFLNNLTTDYPLKLTEKFLALPDPFVLDLFRLCCNDLSYNVEYDIRRLSFEAIKSGNWKGVDILLCFRGISFDSVIHNACIEEISRSGDVIRAASLLFAAHKDPKLSSERVRELISGNWNFDISRFVKFGWRFFDSETQSLIRKKLEISSQIPINNFTIQLFELGKIPECLDEFLITFFQNEQNSEPIHPETIESIKSHLSDYRNFQVLSGLVDFPVFTSDCISGLIQADVESSLTAEEWVPMLEGLVSSSLKHMNFLVCIFRGLSLACQGFYDLEISHITNKVLDKIMHDLESLDLKEVAKMPGYELFGPCLRAQHPLGHVYVGLRIFAVLLRRCPSIVVDWFNQADKSARLVAEGLCKGGLSMAVISDELKWKTDNADVRVQFSKSARQLCCNFQKSELTSQLIANFPQVWPLRPAEVETTPIPGVNKSKNKHMALAVQLAISSSTIDKAVNAWAKNISAVLEGVEECYICYSVVHVESNSLPSKQCGTCKNKYHNDCIFKWFRTSHKTNCPICQTPFYI